MRVVMEVVAGPLAGRRFNLVRNQRLEVGSTARADVCVRGDSLLAPQHFVLETDYQLCRIRDLAKQSSTLVNGEPVELAVLRSGDQIRAGNSAFLVKIEGDAVEVPAEVAAQTPKAASVAVPQAAAVTATYKTSTCDTGLTRYEVDARQYPPGQLVAALGAEWPVVLLADNRRLHDPALDALAAPRYLFNWLGDAAAQLSPVILFPGDAEDPAALVARSWRKDGVAVLFLAKEPNDALVSRLQGLARVGEDRVLGICWPSILASLLSHYQADYVKVLMEPLCAVMIETPSAHDCWQLYTNKSLDEKLQSLGIKPYAPKEV